MKILSIAAAFATIMVSQGALSQNRLPDALHCVGVENDIARLECYDSAYDSFRAAETAQDNWQIVAKTNPLDDTVTTVFIVESSGGTSPVFGEHRLIIRCRGNELNIWIDWHQFLSTESASDVTWRVGKQKAQSGKWPHGASSSSLTFYPHDEPELVTQMIDSDQFVAQTKAATGDTLTAIFNVRGLEQAVTPIKDDCLQEDALTRPDYMNKEIYEALKSIKQRDEYRSRSEVE